MIPLVLWFLATIDAAFIGYREAAGRNALINKRAYYRKAMLRGAAIGQIAVLLAAVLLAAAVFSSSEPTLLMADLYRVGARMLVVYIPFALIIFAAFALRAAGSVDIKSLTSTVIFGPFTLLRPLVATGGLIYGWLAAPKLSVFLLGGLVLSLMLGLETVIGQFRRRNWIS